MVQYTLDKYGKMAIRSSDNACIPWDTQNDRPLDIYGLVGRIWQEDGSPASIPYTPTINELITEVSAIASSATSFILNQVAPDTTHLIAYQNAAAIATMNGGAPTVEPLKTAFNTQAEAFGYTPTEFATLAISISAASMTLSAILTSLQSSISSATNVNDLQNAIDTFNTAIGNLVSSLNSLNLKVVVKAPDILVIPNN